MLAQVSAAMLLRTRAAAARLSLALTSLPAAVGEYLESLNRAINS